MRTTLTLDDDVVARLNEEMRRTGRCFKAIVNDTLREGLALRNEPAEAPPFVVRARELGLAPGHDYSNIGDLLEVAGGPSHR